MASTSAYQVAPMPLASLVHLVNGWGDIPRDVAGQSSHPYPDRDALTAPVPEFWSQFEMFDESILVDAANRIHRIFAAGSGEECATLLNGAMTTARMTPNLAAEGWVMHVEWWSRLVEMHLLASAALQLFDHLRHDPDASRLGVCADEGCAQVFVDLSRSGMRQFCSITCQNRARARNHRARKRAEAAAS